jgi:hypothetical protein
MLCWSTAAAWADPDGKAFTTRGRLLTKRACAMIVEVKGSHSIYVSQPQAVVTPIEQAAKGALLVGAH